MSTDRMPVIFLDHEGSPGGGQLSAKRLLPRLRALAPRPVFITPGPVAEELSAAGLPVEVLFPASHGYRAWKAPFYALKLAWLLRKLPPEAPIVALSTASAQVLAFIPRSRRRRLLRLSEDMARYDGRSLKSIAYFQWIFRRFDGFIANSKWTATTIPPSLSSIPSQLAYPLSGLREQLRREVPPLSSERVHIACFSRPVAWKGLDLAIAAVTDLSARGHDVCLTIFGGGWQSDGSYQKHLKELADRSRAPIRFAGHVEDVLHQMEDVDVVVLPSRLPEPYGQVTAQALASGCLTVVSAHGGSLELIEDGVTGLTFTSDDSVVLAEVLDKAITHRDQSREIAAAGQRYASQLSDDSLARAFESALRELLDASSRTPDMRLEL